MEKQKKKGSGSFYVPKAAIKRLMETGDDAKWLIPAYLKIAAHTDESGLYSTAGHTSIRKTLRRNKDDAIKFVKQLIKMKLLHTAEQWTKKTGEIFPDDVPERREIKYVLNDFNEDRQKMVWFGRGIVDGIGDFENPLRELANCGPDAARMLLYFHQEYDPFTFHACNPLSTTYRHYAPHTDHQATNYMIKGWERKHDSLQPDVLKNVFPDKDKWSELREEAIWNEKEAHWDAFKNLVAAGFIYEVAAVVSTPIKEKVAYEKWDYADMTNVGVVYELANLDRFADTTGALHEDIKSTYQRGGGECLAGYVYSILPTGSNHSVMGLFRPRFVIDNKRNAFVAEALENQEMDRDRAMKWLNHFKVTKGLTPPSQKQPDQPEEKVCSLF